MEIEYFIDPEADFKVIQEEWITELLGAPGAMCI